jgi:uroporphyrin-III C-methyltransferase/precorrin-2 dehydrogenase/sirohydrochlorin ferrochelatase
MHPPQLDHPPLGGRQQSQARRTGIPSEVLDGCALVIAATDDKSVNHQADAAKARNIPVNVVDQPDLWPFIMPSIIDRSR